VRAGRRRDRKTPERKSGKTIRQNKNRRFLKRCIAGESAGFVFGNLEQKQKIIE